MEPETVRLEIRRAEGIYLGIDAAVPCGLGSGIALHGCPLAVTHRPSTAFRYHCRMLITTASLPRLSINPCRLAIRRKITPLPFCSHRSPALLGPKAKP